MRIDVTEDFDNENGGKTVTRIIALIVVVSNFSLY